MSRSDMVYVDDILESIELIFNIFAIKVKLILLPI